MGPSYTMTSIDGILVRPVRHTWCADSFLVKSSSEDVSAAEGPSYTISSICGVTVEMRVAADDNEATVTAPLGGAQ